MAQDHKYNGWTNYETWAVKLWMDNEEPSYRYWRERAELERTAVGPQAAWPVPLTEAGRGRRSARLLGCTAEGLWRNARATLLGAQDGERAEQHPQERAATGQGRYP